MNDKRIAIFEEITPAFHSLVKKYLKDGFTIYYFRINDKYKNQAYIKRSIKEEKIIDMNKMIFDYILPWAALYAHENVDYIFDKYYAHSPSIKSIQKLLDFPKIIDMYKKEILFKIERLYNIELRINEFVEKNKTVETIHFLTSNNFEIHSDQKSKLNTKIQVIQIRNIKTKVNNIRKKLKKILFYGAPIYLFLKKCKKISNNKKRPEFKVGITIDHPKNIFLMNYYTETIFIDDKDLPKEEVLFIDEVGEVNVNDYKKRGYNYTRLIKDKEIISWNLVWNKIIKRFIPTLIKIVFFSTLEELIINDINYKILSDYIKWNILADSYNINNYVKRGTPDNISKVHILSQSNIKTWFILPNNSPKDVHTDWDESKINITILSFIYYDCAIVHGNLVERQLKKQRNFIKEYHQVGTIPSQLVYEIQKGKLKSELPLIIKNKKLPKKIIGIFDTMSVDYGYQKVKDGIKFGNDLLRLLDDYPDIGIILKAKKELEMTPHLAPVYNKLKNHERCIFLARYDPKGISAAEVIAVSDFVISIAYTSTTAEALGTKKKAIYYDVVGKQIGDKYYLNRFPNFVAHNYDELKELINYWMNDVTDEEFEDFLDTYVRDELDPYLDYKALTRTRKLLTEWN